jgi:anti-anti-sigma regulatory factor
MTCRIDRLVTAAGGVVLSLSGRITAQTLDVLQDMLGREKGPVAIDLRGVLLVDSDAVQFLAAEEAKGIDLRNCPAYIREWIVSERAQPKPGPERRDP